MRNRTTVVNERRKRSYHHGDLRRALLESAMNRLESEGVNGLTLRAVARDAGVSHNAPYHHFPNAASLLAALAAAGLRALGEAMEERAGAARGDALGRLQQSGIAYVLFAARRPDLFRLMFSSTIAGVRDPELRAAARATFGIVRGYVRDCYDEGVVDPNVHDAQTTAVAAWSLSHGLAHLVVDRQLGSRGTSQAKIEAEAEAITGAFVRGLAMRPRKR